MEEKLKQKLSVIISNTETSGHEKLTAIVDLFDSSQFEPQVKPANGEKTNEDWNAYINNTLLAIKEDMVKYHRRTNIPNSEVPPSVRYYLSDFYSRIIKECNDSRLSV